MESEEKATQQKSANIYLGNFKTKKRKNGEEFLVGTICIESVQDIPEEHIIPGSNGKSYVKVIVQKSLSGADKYGNTHTIKVDTFKPIPSVDRNA